MCGFDRFGDFSVVLRWLPIVSSAGSSLMVALTLLSAAFTPLTATATALGTASLAAPSVAPLIKEVSRSKTLSINYSIRGVLVAYKMQKPCMGVTLTKRLENAVHVDRQL